MAVQLLLTTDQLAAGLATLENGKLTASQVDDLYSIFRGYLGNLAPNYPILTVLRAEDDDESGGARRCEKLAACLILFQEDQFTPESGFAPTAANRTGFNYSADGEMFEIFKYCFGLFWDIPKEMTNRFQNAGSSRTSAQGRFVNTNT